MIRYEGFSLGFFSDSAGNIAGEQLQVYLRRHHNTTYKCSMTLYQLNFSILANGILDLENVEFSPFTIALKNEPYIDQDAITIKDSELKKAKKTAINYLIDYGILYAKNKQYFVKRFN